MKTDQRPEIADDQKLPALIQQLAPYWRAIAGTCVLAIGLMLASGLIASNRKNAREAEWTDFLGAKANRDPTELGRIASASTGAVAPWAQQAAAQAKLIEASAAVHTDRDAAKRSYQEALDGFTKAISQAGDYELISQRSMWGLAQSHEGLQELIKAKQQYQQLVDKWPDSSIAKQAQERITSLSDPKTEEFYKWFFAQEPPAKLPASGEVPAFPSFELPTEPDVSVPDPPSSSPATTGEVSAEQSIEEATADQPSVENDLGNDLIDESASDPSPPIDGGNE